MAGKRRGAGEGSVTQFPDGRWWARVDDGYHIGRDGRRKRKQKAYYGRTKVDVIKKLNRALSDREAGRPLVNERMTVEQHLDEWLEAVRPSLRQGSYAGYELNVRRAKSTIGHLRLARLAPSDLQRLYARLLQGDDSHRPLSRRSVEQCHTVLHKAFKQAVSWERIARNPSDHVEVPRPEHKEMRTLSQQELGTLLGSTDNDRLHALWVLLATTGLRLGEALGLRWGDIDWTAGTLQVRRSLQHKRGAERGLMLAEPKTKSSRRTVNLAADVVPMLRKHRRRQNTERLGKGKLWVDQGFVFTTNLGAPIGPRNIGYYLDRALRKAGLPHVRVHDLRHTAATLLLQWGTHPKVVQEMLGHSTIAITLDLYSHVIPTMHREAAQQFGRLFRPGLDTAEASS